MILGSFVFFLVIFFIIGISSSLVAQRTAGDYYLASRTASPIFVGLSAMSTNNSGYMFIGLMGYTYIVGLDIVWLLFGWIVGDFFTSFFIHRKLQQISERRGALTFAQAISQWSNSVASGNFAFIRLLIALISIVFLSIYAAAQLNAGGKSFEALFDFPQVWGAFLVAVMVAVYCFAGGIRASMWTDVAQTMVMLFSMAILAIVAITATGGLAASYAALAAIPNYLDLFPYDNLPFSSSAFSFIGAPLFIFGWLVSGFCAAGQPHIMVRFMTMQNSTQFTAVRWWYYGFYTLFAFFAVIVGLMTRIHLPDIGTMDAELVLPTMARNLLPEIIVGAMLAGIFAAIMSTADSLLLSCSSALTHDLMPEKFETPLEMKLATLGMTGFAFGVAWYAISAGGQNVFTLVQFAWAGMGAAFGPLLLLLSLGKKIKPTLAFTMIITGLVVVIGWRQLDLPLNMFNDGVAGVIASFFVWVFLVKWEKYSNIGKWIKIQN